MCELILLGLMYLGIYVEIIQFKKSYLNYYSIEILKMPLKNFEEKSSIACNIYY